MATITFTRGDSDELERDVDISDIVPDTLAKAFFTVKRRLVDDDAHAIIQKTITPTLTADGQIDDIGTASPAADAHMFFLLSGDDTAALSDKVLYHYSIKAFSSSGAPRTIEDGRLSASPQVTQANS